MAKTVDVEERREYLVAAAMRVVAAVGLDGTTMRAIAAEADCTTGMVTHYFENKDQILTSLVAQVSSRAQQRMKEACAGKSGLPRLRALLVASSPLDEERNVEWRIWLALWNKSIIDGALSLEWARHERRWNQLVRRAVDETVDLGHFPADTDRDREVLTLSVFTFGLAVEAMLSPRQVGPHTMTTVIDGYLANRSILPAASTAQ